MRAFAFAFGAGVFFALTKVSFQMFDVAWSCGLSVCLMGKMRAYRLLQAASVTKSKMCSP